VLDVNRILEVIPHRYPFLLVDRIVELEQKVRAVGIKNVSANEAFFQGHFPGNPIMPGVLIIEAMAQVGAILPDRRGQIVYFAGIDKARFRKPVRPGDQLLFRVEVLKLKSRSCKIRGEAYVKDQLVAEAEILSTVGEKGSARDAAK
jgi:3-hydroxyacyl-[acyl-carrier-protein] dehydratase